MRKVYFGSGVPGMLAAEVQALEASQRTAELEERRACRKRYETVDEMVSELDRFVDLLFRASMMAAGFHQRRGSAWRRRRGPQKRRQNAAVA